MKKRFFSVSAIIAIVASLMMSSCIGSFKLSNKLLSWNKTIGNKFVNELVFVAFWIIPVYEVAGLADIVVLNSIEFWSGNNPIAKGKRVIDGTNDKYLVDCDGKGYTITAMSDKSSVRLNFNTKTQTWSYTAPNGEVRDLITFVDDTHVKMPTNDGGYQVVELSQAGIYAYKASTVQSLFAKN